MADAAKTRRLRAVQRHIAADGAPRPPRGAIDPVRCGHQQGGGGDESGGTDLPARIQADYDEQGAEAYASATNQDWRDVEAYTINSALGDLTDMRCLDLACGNGRSTRIVAAHNPRSIVGVDFSEELLVEARRLEAASPTGRVRYEYGDIFNLGAVGGAAGAFDLVIAIFALHYAPGEHSLRKCVRDIHTNLKPGGRFVSLVGHMDKFAHTSAEHLNAQYAVVGFEMEFGRWPPAQWDQVKYNIYDKDPRAPGSERVFHLRCSYVSISVYEQACRLAGFSRVEFKQWSYKGRAEGKLQSFFERVIEVEPHICLVATK
jgi:toxoflavin synthase